MPTHSIAPKNTRMTPNHFKHAQPTAEYPTQDKKVWKKLEYLQNTFEQCYREKNLLHSDYFLKNPIT
jgi:hypothetical protein